MAVKTKKQNPKSYPFRRFVYDVFTGDRRCGGWKSRVEWHGTFTVIGWSHCKLSALPRNPVACPTYRVPTDASGHFLKPSCPNVRPAAPYLSTSRTFSSTPSRFALPSIFSSRYRHQAHRSSPTTTLDGNHTVRTKPDDTQPRTCRTNNRKNRPTAPTTTMASINPT